MKWGVRKDRRGGLPSARKLKKKIAKANTTPYKNKHTMAVNKKINKETDKTKEAKELNTALSYYQNQIKKANGAKVLIPTDEMKNLDKLYERYEKKFYEIANKHIDEYAGALIKDLGYEDTQAGRDYLKKKGLV